MKKLVLICLFLCSLFMARGQLELQVSAAKSDLRNNILSFGIKYIRSLDSIYGNQELFVPGKNSFFVLTPQADIRTGTEDAFSSITVKATGMLVKFKILKVGEMTTPDFDKVFHMFPVSVGAETNNQFDNINGILEVGWIPYYQSYGGKTPDWLRKTNIGFFLQAGYKFKADTTGNNAVGGEIDESQERPDNGLLRARGSASLNTGDLVQIGGFSLGLVGNADVWYDFVHTVFYYRLDGRARLFLTPTQYLDFIYAKGSGAPNFNTGDQYGIGLTIVF